LLDLLSRDRDLMCACTILGHRRRRDHRARARFYRL